MPSLVGINGSAQQKNFPGATFVIEGEVPEAQCSEAKIESILGFSNGAEQKLREVGKFTGFALAGKHVTITLPAPIAGTFNIISNTNDILNTDQFFPDPVANINYFCHNGGSLILTRDVASFAEFIRNSGYAYTIKGGKLYTNIPSNDLQPACTILFDPLT